jgi:hypothetical protein
VAALDDGDSRSVAALAEGFRNIEKQKFSYDDEQEQAKI